MRHIPLEREVHGVAHGVVALHVDGGHDDDDVLPLCGNVQMHGGAHHFADVHLCGDAGVADDGMLRTDAERDILRLDVVRGKARFLLRVKLHLDAAQLDKELVAVAGEVRIEEVHLRRADEARDEEVAGVVKHFLRRADLLDVAVAHDDYTVAKGHGLGLVMGDVDEGGVDTLTQLDYLGAHLVPQLRVEVGKRLVHEEDGGVAHDGAADCDALALAAGERLRLAVEVLGDVEDLRRLAHLLVDNVLLLLAQLQREGHIFIHRHVRVERVVLEHHCDVAVLRGNVVHELAVDVKLALGDLFQPCHHAQRGGLAAAGRADQNDEFLVRDVKVELLHRNDALIRNLKVDLLLLALVLLLFLLALAADERVDLLHIFKLNSCHTFRLRSRGLRRS